MSKKITLDEAQIAQVEALSAYLSIEQIANYFGFSEDTFYELKKRDRRVLRAYKKGKAKAIGIVASKLMKLIDQGDVTATIFYLKTQGGWSTDSKGTNIIKISFGNRTATEIINSTLTALEEGKISVPEVQQLTGLAIAKMNIENNSSGDDKAVYQQRSREEALEFAAKIKEARENIKFFNENNIKPETINKSGNA
ncbi:luxR family transcriptional regulator (plasmid) [Candidatus Megaera polyxenophila]|nr:luxR family transcriptional regulator [Candidatus Megaera polyxenophila]